MLRFSDNRSIQHIICCGSQRTAPYNLLYDSVIWQSQHIPFFCLIFLLLLCCVCIKTAAYIAQHIRFFSLVLFKRSMSWTVLTRYPDIGYPVNPGRDTGYPVASNIWQNVWHNFFSCALNWWLLLFFCPLHQMGQTN